MFLPFHPLKMDGKVTLSLSLTHTHMAITVSQEDLYIINTNTCE